MLNQDRVILMTRMAAYEGGEGKKNMAVGKYFRSDYVSIQVLKSFISGTISFALVVALYAYYNFETLMAEMYDMDLLDYVGGILRKYVWFIAIYLLISYVVCTLKYMGARKKLRRYYKNLKKLNKLYHEE